MNSNSNPDAGIIAATPLVCCGLVRRLLAIIYDAVILVGLLLIAGALALPVSGDAQALRNIPYTLYLSLVVFIYFAWCWTHSGQTLGMRAWQVRLVGLDSQSVSWRTSAVRFAMSILSVACLGAGFLSGLFRKDRCCWQDLMSDTRIVRVADLKPNA